MSICVLAGLEALAVLISGVADELDPVGEFARFASKIGFVVLAVVLLSGYFVRRRQLALARTKTRRRRHRRRHHADEARVAEPQRADEKPLSRFGKDL